VTIDIPVYKRLIGFTWIHIITQSVLHPRPGAPAIAKSQRAQEFVEEWFSPHSQRHNVQNRWARQFIYGVEDNPDLALATKVNMIVFTTMATFFSMNSAFILKLKNKVGV
jgi:hypothetical protein